MRLFLLPISTRRTLLYAHRHAPPPSAQSSYADRITARAAKQWRSWEAAEGGWKRKVTDWGNAAFARIPYQEWGLKSVPSLASSRQLQESGQANTSALVDVVFPPNVLKKDNVEPTLRQLATERQDLHRRSMRWSIAGLPLTLPFVLIPVIPNLPFFYLAFRIWSHWKALKGSEHVQYLLAQDLLRLRPSPILQHVYNLRTVPQERLEELKTLISDDKIDGDDGSDLERDDRVTAFLERAAIERNGVRSKDSSDSATPAIADSLEPLGRERLLLDRASGKLLSRSVGVPGLDIEIERAVDQVTRLIAADEKKIESAVAEAQRESNASQKDKQA